MIKIKAILSFILVAVCFLSVQNIDAQNLATDQFVYDYSGVASDTVGIGTTTWFKELNINKPQMLYYNNQLKVTKVSGSPRATIKLQGKIFSTDTYTDITTTAYYGTTADTTINYTQVTTKQSYRYYKLLITATAGRTKVTWYKASYKY